jgi:hypothetical protein
MLQICKHAMAFLVLTFKILWFFNALYIFKIKKNYLKPS